MRKLFLVLILLFIFDIAQSQSQGLQWQWAHDNPQSWGHVDKLFHVLGSKMACQEFERFGLFSKRQIAVGSWALGFLYEIKDAYIDYRRFGPHIGGDGFSKQDLVFNTAGITAYYFNLKAWHIATFALAGTLIDNVIQDNKISHWHSSNTKFKSVFDSNNSQMTFLIPWIVNSDYRHDFALGYRVALSISSVVVFEALNGLFRPNIWFFGDYAGWRDQDITYGLISTGFATLYELVLPSGYDKLSIKPKPGGLVLTVNF